MNYADQYEMIVCSGDDGTISEIMSGIIRLKSCCSIGIVSKKKWKFIGNIIVRFKITC